MDAEIHNVIYMELNSGPKIANSTCGKTIDVETIDRDSTVSIVSVATILGRYIISAMLHKTEEGWLHVVQKDVKLCGVP